MITLNDVTDKLNIEYDLNFELHILRYKNSLYKFNRRYKELKPAIEKFKSGDYGNISQDVVEDNQRYIKQKKGIIRGLYICYDSVIEITTFLWHNPDGEQNVKTLLYCRRWQEYRDDEFTLYWELSKD